jgi:hypothetical protein
MSEPRGVSSSSTTTTSAPWLGRSTAPSTDHPLSNPAAAARGPKHVVKTGKTPVLEGAEWHKLLAMISATTLRDLRDGPDCHPRPQLRAHHYGVEDEGRGSPAARRWLDDPIVRERRQAANDAVPSRARREPSTSRAQR